MARPWVHPEMHEDAAAAPIESAPLPPLFVVPVRQHIGESAEPVVDVGARVLRDEPIARPQGYVSAALHAPTSGTVVKIEEHAIVHPSGIGMRSIFIEADGEDRSTGGWEGWPDWPERDPAELRERIRACGIVGLGGALFPTFVKLARDPRHPIETLILNGVECEPWLACDHRLMVEEAERIVAGMAILRHVVGAARCVVAIEENKPDAAEAMERASIAGGLHDVAVRLLPVRYPQGSERQLIETITGRQVPAGRLPLHVGVLCVNVATSAAVADAVLQGRPLTERVVTLGGEAMPQPANLRVRIGTPIDFLLRRQGLLDLEGIEIIQGGPMMGERVLYPEAPVTKGSNAILAMARRPVEPESPCIRCGHCLQVCPAGLMPNELAAHCRNDRFEQAEAFHLFDCIECGACSYICPAHIPLVHYFRYGKGQVAAIRRARAFADASRRRSEAREERLRREQEERAARRRSRRPAAGAGVEERKQ